MTRRLNKKQNGEEEEIKRSEWWKKGMRNRIKPGEEKQENRR